MPIDPNRKAANSATYAVIKRGLNGEGAAAPSRLLSARAGDSLEGLPKQPTPKPWTTPVKPPDHVVAAARKARKAAARVAAQPPAMDPDAITVAPRLPAESPDAITVAPRLPAESPDAITVAPRPPTPMEPLAIASEPALEAAPAPVAARQNLRMAVDDLLHEGNADELPAYSEQPLPPNVEIQVAEVDDDSDHQPSRAADELQRKSALASIKEALKPATTKPRSRARSALNALKAFAK